MNSSFAVSIRRPKHNQIRRCEGKVVTMPAMSPSPRMSPPALAEKQGNRETIKQMFPRRRVFPCPLIPHSARVASGDHCPHVTQIAIVSTRPRKEC